MLVIKTKYNKYLNSVSFLTFWNQALFERYYLHLSKSVSQSVSYDLIGWSLELTWSRIITTIITTCTITTSCTIMHYLHYLHLAILHHTCTILHILALLAPHTCTITTICNITTTITTCTTTYYLHLTQPVFQSVFYDLNGFKSRINRHLLTIVSF